MPDASALSGRLPPLDPIAEHDPDGFAALLAKVERDRLFRCRSYKERCLRRRIGVRMRATGVHTFADYAQVLDCDAGEYERLLDALTINVTKLFRNAEAWSSLADRVLPDLFATARRPVRAWSAGTASGEEAYSVAALLADACAARGESSTGKVEVLGTDVDRASLDAAVGGEYAEAAFQETPPPVRARFFTDEVPARVRPALRDITRFAQHDLLREPVPVGPWDLIVCRNVVIYFDRESQEALFERFHAVLASGGTLFLGKVETLFGRVRGLYTPIDHRQRIFRRA